MEHQLSIVSKRYYWNTSYLSLHIIKMAPVSAAQKRKYNKVRMQQKRATETPEEIEIRREKDRGRKRKIDNTEETTEKKERRAKDRRAKRIQRVQETPEITIKRRTKDKLSGPS